jgi:uncharacterized protein
MPRFKPTDPSNDVRLVLDTNTAISGLLWGGAPSQLIDDAQDQKIELISSLALLTELDDVITRRKFIKQLTKRDFTCSDISLGYRALVSIVIPAAITPTILRDPSDDRVLAAALAGQADFIVSGDPHLLDLKRFINIPIINATYAVQQISS